MSLIDKHLYKKREKINRQNKKRLKNINFSLIASNCTGGFILHDLKLKFRSPFVNLYMKPFDFIKYLEKMDYYNLCEFTFESNLGYSYPVGKLDDLTVYFVHYKNKEDAIDSWKRRLERLNKENLFIIMTERDGCTYEDLKRFDKLPYQNKIVFTHKKYSEIKSSYYIKGFEKEKQVGDLFRYKNKWSGKKFYDDFDYVEWFNGEKLKK